MSIKGVRQAELARAKVNLCLHVTGRRPDGYHRLDSIVVFPKLGDRIEVEPASQLSLAIKGPFAPGLSAGDDNLVIRAARLMGGKAAILLEKNLPVAAGIGGGSADAAAVLRALAKLNEAPLPDQARLTSLGADIPVCIGTHPQRMRGIGDDLSALPSLPPVWCVLANAGPMVATSAVFDSLETRHNSALPPLPDTFAKPEALFAYLSNTRNDLEAPARALQPLIGEVIEALRATGAALARMSGSGGTCFGLYKTQTDALAAATTLRTQYPKWWVAAAGF